MTRQPTRTDLFEAHQRKIAELRNSAIDARTLSRAYADLSETIKTLPTRGQIWDVAQRDLVAQATENAREFLNISKAKWAEADLLEEKGLE